jgi:glycosyltransferase involved in cell wall biosynthesis
MTLISVITPSFNQGQFIQATLDSVLQQDYADIEYMVRDGGSTDETIEILRRCNDPRLKWVSEPDNGQSDAINKGLQLASGEILAYLNSDDIYLPGALKFIADYFETHPEVDLIYGDCLAVDANGKEIGHPLRSKPISIKEAILKYTYIPQPATFWRRRITDAIGFFDESLHFAMDRDYWIRAAISGFALSHVDRQLAGFRFHEESKTVSQGIKFWEDRLAIIEKIFKMPEMPDDIRGLKSDALCYANYYGAEILWNENERKQARPLLKDAIQGKGPFHIRFFALAMLFDSYFHTPFSAIGRNLYLHMKFE